MKTYKSAAAKPILALLLGVTVVGGAPGCSNQQRNSNDSQGNAAVRRGSDGGAQSTVTAREFVHGTIDRADSGAATLASAAVPADPPGDTTETILASISPDCLACARAVKPGAPCDLKSASCESLPEGKARKECLDTLRCVFPGGSKRSCVDGSNSNLTSCYCGASSVEACLEGKANGICRHVIEVGLRSTDTEFAARNLTNTTYSSGLAMQFAQCLSDIGLMADRRCRSCF